MRIFLRDFCDCALLFYFYTFLACIETYLETLLAGFGGSPNMVSGTIIAISKIVYEYRGI